jgi:hypothetical protein
MFHDVAEYIWQALGVAAAEAEAAAARVASEHTAAMRSETTRLTAEITSVRRALSGERDDATARLAAMTSRVSNLELEIDELRRLLAEAEAAPRAPPPPPPADDSDSDGEMISAAAFLKGDDGVKNAKTALSKELNARPKKEKSGRFGAALDRMVERCGLTLNCAQFQLSNLSCDELPSNFAFSMKRWH